MLITLKTLALYSLLAGTPDSTEAKTDARRAEAVKKPKADAGTSLTPMDQSNDEFDVKLTQRVRQAVVGDNRLSFTAKNVKIITSAGVVTLRGEVKSNEERNLVCTLAAKEAGAGKVKDELELPGARPANTNSK